VNPLLANQKLTLLNYDEIFKNSTAHLQRARAVKITGISKGSFDVSEIMFFLL
jgi:hypothetical protein